MPKIFDLTACIKNGCQVFPGDPSPTIEQITRLEEAGYNNFLLTTGMHSGTHIDGPLHMHAGAEYLSEIRADRFFGSGKLIDARSVDWITPDLLDPGIGDCDVLLIFTGCSEHREESDYYNNHPVLSEEFAREVIKRKIKMIGLDSPSPDRAPYSVHKLLLENRILIIENLVGLEQLLNQPTFEVIALPTKIESDSAPARVIAIVR